MVSCLQLQLNSSVHKYGSLLFPVHVSGFELQELKVQVAIFI